MDALSEHRIDVINDRLVRNGLTDDGIRTDLLDHVCCLTEVFMERGDSFEAACDLAFAEFQPQEFEQIQELSLHYIHLKQNTMKKTIGIMGIVTSMLIILGVAFKMGYMPGANLLLLMGLALTGLVILPLMAYAGYSKTDSATSKITHAAGYLAAVLHCLAALFILLHWEGAAFFSVLGIFVLCGVFMPLYIIKSYRTSENKILGLSKSFLILAGIILFWGLATRRRAPEPQAPTAALEVEHTLDTKPYSISTVIYGPIHR